MYGPDNPNDGGTMSRNAVAAYIAGLSCFALVLGIGYAAFSFRTKPLLERQLTGIARGLPQPAITKPEQLPRAVQRLPDQPVPILMYHYVRTVSASTDPLGYDLSVTPELLDEQLDALAQAGYHTITPSELALGDLPEKPILLSFDDGYADTYTAAFPRLKARGMTAVVFVITGSLDDADGRYLRRSQVQELADAGIEIGSHTVSHLNLVAAEPRRRQDELLISRQVLEQLTNKRVIAVSYPAGETNADVARIATYVGYTLGVTTHHGVALPASQRLLLPRIRVRGGQSATDLLSSIERAVQSTAAPIKLDGSTSDPLTTNDQ